MTRRLILMRHAKSSWDDPLQTDHERPLNSRGRKSAKAMGNWLRQEGYIPDEALVSDAERTRETYARLALDAEPKHLGSLYHASEDLMFAELQRSIGHSVLMLGHNPGIAFFAEMLCANPPRHAKFALYPTCATLVLDFEISTWRDLRRQTGKLVAFKVPRELIA